jgi:hypothetical protein
VASGDAAEDSDGAGHLYPSWTSSHENERQQIFVQSWILFRLRDLKGAQDIVSECLRVGKTLEPRSILFVFRVAENNSAPRR